MFSTFIIYSCWFSTTFITINSCSTFSFKFTFTYFAYFYHFFTSLTCTLYNKILYYNSEHSKFFKKIKNSVNFTLQSFYSWLLVLGSNQRPIGYCTTLIFTSIIYYYIICSLDFIFTISLLDLGRWCKVSTHSFRLARYCRQHYLLRVPPT